MVSIFECTIKVCSTESNERIEPLQITYIVHTLHTLLTKKPCFLFMELDISEGLNNNELILNESKNYSKRF